MPIRAKILNPGFSSQQKMSASSLVIKEQEGDAPNDVLFSSTYGIRTIELNRPNALNALDGSMARKIVPRLREWEKSQMANIIILKGAGRALCSGGDVAALAKLIKSEGLVGVRKAVEYFELEYRLDHLIATYPKPYVAFMDGFTMGGGVGLSIHAPFRIATENTLIAMPETKIGFFPDVGGSFFLPRLDGEIGTYLALTSERLKGVQAFYSGLATHYIHSTSLPDLEARLAELAFGDYQPLEERWKIVDSTIEEFVTGLPEDAPIELSGEIREAIDRCFKFNTIEEILEALTQEDSDWARQTLESIKSCSPTAVRVTLRQLRAGKEWTISETFQREMHMAAKFMEGKDFVEGVDALLISKTMEPKWDPPSLEASDESVTNPYFTVGERDRPRLQLLRDESDAGFVDYKEYPHAKIGLPSEAEVRRLLRERKMLPDDIIPYLVEDRNGKIGLVEKVRDIIARKVGTGVDRAVWKE
ncbi:ClpP/crotonase [Choiromyces venosus 120613-1]|uniref:3-hydroxyisobutyryl-CoA hydrolase n=1 Tax=Choiromyces venosus 120613-1 TaxID=1336337 RepID=A0A3N4JAD0_9PEZI|nr:ClpP/crotonase [Choiromyces venosus 120613-1]